MSGLKPKLYMYLISLEGTFILLREQVPSVNPSSSCRILLQNEFKEDIFKFINLFIQTQGGAVTASCHFF